MMEMQDEVQGGGRVQHCGGMLRTCASHIYLGISCESHFCVVIVAPTKKSSGRLHLARLKTRYGKLGGRFDSMIAAHDIRVPGVTCFGPFCMLSSQPAASFSVELLQGKCCEFLWQVCDGVPLYAICGVLAELMHLSSGHM